MIFSVKRYRNKRNEIIDRKILDRKIKTPELIEDYKVVKNQF